MTLNSTYLMILMLAKLGAHVYICAYVHYSAILRPIALEFFMGAQETIIYRLVMKNLSDDAFFPFLILLATFSGKMV